MFWYEVPHVSMAMQTWGPLLLSPSSPLVGEVEGGVPTEANIVKVANGGFRGNGERDASVPEFRRWRVSQAFTAYAS